MASEQVVVFSWWRKNMHFRYRRSKKLFAITALLNCLIGPNIWTEFRSLRGKVLSLIDLAGEQSALAREPAQEYLK